MNSLPNEEWRTIEEFPNYEVSNLGRVRKCFLLECQIAPHGHTTVTVAKGPPYHAYHRSAAQLVLKTFGTPCQGFRVRHRNGRLEDCRFVNLEWGDLTGIPSRNRLPKTKIRSIRKLWKKGKTIKEISAEVAIAPRSVQNVIEGKSYAKVI